MAPTTRPQRIEPVFILYRERDRMVTFEPEDEDRFNMTVNEVIDACRAYDKEGRLRVQRQFPQLLRFLGQWISERRDKIAKALLTVRDAGLLLVTVTHSTQYDDAFEDALTDLALEAAGHFADLPLDVQSLPKCGPECYLSFCNPEQMILEYRFNA